MENILWIVLAGGVFYFMFRGGEMGCCGGDHSHSSKETNGEKKEGT